MRKIYFSKVCAFLFILLSWGISINAQDGTYCEAAATSDSYEYIENVTYGDVNNNSVREKYGDFTSLVSNFPVGTSFNLSVTVNDYDNDKVWAWIDWNQDFAFAETELVKLTGDGTLTGMINVPTDALPGQTRMRIFCKYGTDPSTDACGTFMFGEVEDYSVFVIADGIYPIFSAAPAFAGVNEEITFTQACINSDEITSYVWNFGDGATPATFEGATPPAVVYSSLGDKTVKLTISDGTDTKFAEKIVKIIPGSAEYSQPQSFTAVANNNVINLSWTVVGEKTIVVSQPDVVKNINVVRKRPNSLSSLKDYNSKLAKAIEADNKPVVVRSPERVTSTGFTGFRVTIDGVATDVTADARSYKFENVAEGEHTCTVTAVYGDNESYATEAITVTTTPPTVSFTVDKAIAGIGEDVVFTGTINGSATSVEWNFGQDATPATANTLVVGAVKYSSLGQKTITLTINGDIVKTMTDMVTIKPGSSNVTPLTGVTAVANYEDVTVTWPSLSSEVSFTEGFEGTWPPAGWEVMTSATIDGALTAPAADAKQWFQCDVNSFGEPHPEFIHSGDYAAGIGYTAPDFNWLITPAIDIVEGNKFNFWIWYMQDADYDTHIRVMVKADGVWNEELFYTNGTPTNELESEVSVDLAAYAGKSVQIAFVYEYTDGYQLIIDDVSVTGAGTRSLADDFSKLNIYRNDVVIKEITDAAAVDYIDQNLATGEYKYYVTFVNASGEESFPCEDIYVRAFNKVDAPYTQDFESDYSDWLFYTGDYAFKVGSNGDFNKAGYDMPEHDGKFVAVNTSDITGGWMGYTKVADIVEFSPVNLNGSGRAYFELDYLADIAGFAIIGRTSPAGEWKIIKQLDLATAWVEGAKVVLPTECLVEGYQFGLYYSNLQGASNGVAFDNVKITTLEGKHIALDYKGSELANNANQFLGKIKEGTTKDYTITVTNIGNEVIALGNISITGDKFSIVSGNRGDLAIGASHNIVVKYTPTAETTTPDEAILTIASDDVDNATFTLNLTAECGTAAWTYMLYLYEDGTGLDGNKDINEWEVLGSIDGKVNYIVLYDCNDDTKDGIYYVKKDAEGMNTTIVSELISTHMNADIDMNDAETLKNFIIWGKENYPAEHFGCNVWDHGSGIFKRGVPQWKSACGDMKVWDLASALKAFKDVDGQGFDIFGFDVCLLGQVETIYDIKDYTKIVVASERTEPGDGWDYTTQFQMLNDGNGVVDIYEFASKIVEEYDASYDNGSQGSRSTTQSATRTDKFISDFIPALNAFADAASFEMYAIKAEVKAARNAAWFSDGADYAEHRDLGNFLDILKTKNVSDELKVKIDELRTAYNSCIVNSLENGHANVATGMKIWMPENINSSTDKDAYLNKLIISETKWDEYLAMYANPIQVGVPAPVVKAVTATSISTNGTVKLQDITETLPAVTGRVWVITPDTYEFVDGDATSEIIEVKFTAAGSYTIKLDVTNAEGTGSTTKADMITVTDFATVAPKELAAEVNTENGEVTLTWQDGDTAGGSTGDEADKLVEGFEGEWLPTNWELKTSTTIDGAQTDPLEANLTNGKAWFKCDENSFKDDAGNPQPKYIHSGTYSAAIGYSAPNFTWLITAPVTVSAEDNLKFWMWYMNGESGGTWYDSNLRIMVEADGAWNQIAFNTTGTDPNEYTSEQVYSLAAYAGKEIRVAFVYEYTDGWQTMVDDIYIGTGANPASTRANVVNPIENKRFTSVATPAQVSRGPIASYNVYRDGVKIADNVTSKTYIDKSLTVSGSYEYYVTTVYSNPVQESDVSNKVSINYTAVENANFPAPTELAANLNSETREVVLTWVKPVDPANTGGSTGGEADKLVEGFEGDWLPTNWELKTSTTIDGAQTDPLEANLTNGKAWFKCDENSFKDDAGNPQPKYIHSGTYSAAIGYSAPNFTWLITAPVTVSAEDNLKFWMWYMNGESGGTWYDSNLRIMVEADGAWNQIAFNTTGTDPNEYTSEQVYSLAAYAGKEIRVAFVYEYTDGWQTMVDDIYIGTGANPASTRANVVNPTTNARFTGVVTPAVVRSNRALTSYNIFRNGEKIKNVAELTYTDQLSDEAGNYEYYVTAVYESPEGESIASNKSSVNVDKKVVLNVPTDLTATLNTDTRVATIAWTKPEGNVESYNVFRNNEKIKNVTTLSYDDQLSDEAGSYEYYVTAVYAEGESVASNKKSISIEKKTPTAIGDGIKLDITAYPNPNNGTFTLNVNDVKEAKWYLLDINGRMVNSGVTTDNNTTINVEMSGVYMVKVIADGKTNYIKVVVK